ncbi:ALK-EXO [Choristoneura occidentalis granulovirus]|uniref:ALK-EXO n=1 Tax=Choristoneura occidentalis granulovirus TaxID=364745 RepID=Q1A4J2_9BBAC|nr:ALK-EXO [Choristoneura fumiferana granulovirus]ABC61238.1 ALK-EXO [Choristoneura fumiferana granulovirus]
MAYELAVSENVLNNQELLYAEKYCLQKYVKRLTLTHRNTKEEIMALEHATRGQTNNMLWKILRINRTTASGGNTFFEGSTPAMRYGICNETILKNNKAIINTITERIEKKLGKKVVENVLDCGLFITDIGLYSASPDGYFKLETGELVVLEIKCPYTYRNKTLEQIRREKNNTRGAYRVEHTALLVNRNGPLHVTVTERNEHYRQMQSQIYVTNAIMAVYMVKFSDMPEIHFVEKNEQYSKEMRHKELAKLQMYVNENKRSQIMIMESERLKTFTNTNFKTGLAAALACDGMYYWCGNVVCYFCCQQFEIVDKLLEEILEEHTECNKEGNISMGFKVTHPRYLNRFDRINSLRKTKENVVRIEELADKGFFYDGSKLVLYCCGGGKDLLGKERHTDQCKKKEN